MYITILCKYSQVMSKSPVDWNLSELRWSFVLLLLYCTLYGRPYFISAEDGSMDRTRLVPKGVTLAWAAELGLATDCLL